VYHCQQWETDEQRRERERGDEFGGKGGEERVRVWSALPVEEEEEEEGRRGRREGRRGEIGGLLRRRSDGYSNSGRRRQHLSRGMKTDRQDGQSLWRSHAKKPPFGRFWLDWTIKLPASESFMISTNHNEWFLFANTLFILLLPSDAYLVSYSSLTAIHTCISCSNSWYMLFRGFRWYQCFVCFLPVRIW